ncbi:Bifunctional protein MdtA [Posidoniimonas polymericola]|uniref:Bifunctional protein MdtA n=1 Tax=Posidoniimonas polymericola TaxID=2528002 RepID=A0A5C5YTE7_9BACT|nr:NAD(P)-dependent methylenetetrahydromethanopterin dehydrogenase [Posidoniimonas polymericola]TWT78274.1 Bifunctional protein MdtA [Posidoniimonas polymericola]
MPAKILLCLDSDPQPSVFDAVVAVDSGVDHLLRHGGVTPADVEGLVHGAMFTRAPDQLQNTALFIGGSDVAAGEELLAAAAECFFGPMRVSVLLDSNGCNTTAAAAVLAASRHAELGDKPTATVLGSGPVGQRIALLLAGEGVRVQVASRKQARAREVCERLADHVDGSLLEAVGRDQKPVAAILSGGDLLFSAGPAGVEMVTADELAAASPRVAIDLNAAPPLGIGGIEVTDKAVDRSGCVSYGAIGVGGTKMKIHRAAIARLFETNDAVLDAAEVYELGKAIG